MGIKKLAAAATHFDETLTVLNIIAQEHGTGTRIDPVLSGGFAVKTNEGKTVYALWIDALRAMLTATLEATGKGITKP